MSEYRELANAIRALSMDGVQKAKSGHLVLLWVWQIWQRLYGADFTSQS